MHARTRTAAGWLVAGVVIMLTSLGLITPTAAVPKGNNGTIKIDAVTLHGGQANEPHVDCQFAVEFFGYDKGDLEASITFTLQSPTRRPSGSQVLLTDSVAIGEDPAGGGTDLDASKLYQLDFTGVSPQPQQGYHVKVTIHADGSQGADTKHKVFWVQPCEVPTTTTTTTTTSTSTTAPGATSTTALSPTTVTTPPSTTPTTTEVLGGQQTTTTIAPQVLGEHVERSTLPRTGNGVAVLALLGGLALAVGGLVSLLSPSEGPAERVRVFRSR